MRVFRPLQRCCWAFKSSEILRYVVALAASDVSKHGSTFTFRSQQSKK